MQYTCRIIVDYIMIIHSFTGDSNNIFNMAGFLFLDIFAREIQVKDHRRYLHLKNSSTIIDLRIL